MAPRLPDDSVLGGLPSGNSQRPIAMFDTTAPGRAMEQLGRGIQNLGAGIGQGIQAYADRQEKQTILDETTAESQRTVERLKWNEKVNNTTDPDQIEALRKEREAVDERYLSNIKDPARRQATAARWTVETAKDGIVANSRHKTLYDDKVVGQANNEAEEQRRLALELNTPEARNAAIEAVNKRVDGLVVAGIRTPEQAVEMKRKWAESFAWDAVKLMPAEQRISALGGIKEGLRAKESSGNSRIVNGNGFVGSFQFGAPRLQTMGVYTPGPNEDLSSKGWNKTGANYPGKWSGTFNIPGFPQVKTMEDFRSSPEAQEAAYAIHDGLMEKEIRSRGLDAYIGQTIGGVRMTADGIKAMIHLGGAGNAKKFLDSGGRIDAEDANGTKLSQYAKLGETSRSPLSAAISPERRAQLIQDSTKEVAAQRTQLANERVAQNAVRLNDLEVGAHDGRYTLADVQTARDAGWLTDFDQIKKVEGIIEAREKKDGDVRLYTELTGRGEKINPFEKSHTDAAEAAVDAIFKASNGQLTKPAAAMRVFEHSGGTYLPKSGAAAVRGALISNDVESVADAANIASNMLARNPNAFSGAQGEKDLEAAAVDFSHYTNDLGMSREEAARRIMLEQSAEYKSKIKVQDGEIKKFNEDIRKNAVTDLKKASFPGSAWLYGSNDLGAPTVREAVSYDYAQLATMRYQETGDVEGAKRYAVAQLSKMWGVTQGERLMKFPPELARGYPKGPDGTHAYVYRQAAEAVKDARGHVVEPKDIVLMEAGKVQTAEAFRSGAPVPYTIMYFRKDADGYRVPEYVYGRDGDKRKFAADPKAAYDAHKKEQEKAFMESLGPRGPAIIPQASAADMPARSMRPGRPENTLEQRETMAAEQNADTAARAGTLAEQETMRKELEKTTRQQTKEAVEGGGTVRNWLESTPKNPLKGFVPKEPYRGKKRD